MVQSLRFGPADVRILEDVAAYSGHFSVRKLILQHRCFSGDWSDPLSREVFERGDAVGVLPYDPESDTLVMIEQFRPGARRAGHSPWMLELVAGVVEAGESDIDVVHREAWEEAGCSLVELVPIASFFPSAGACTEQVRLFCGRVESAQVGSVLGLASEGEDILVHSVPRREALKMFSDNQIPNGHTLIALQWLQIHGDDIRQRWGYSR